MHRGPDTHRRSQPTLVCARLPPRPLAPQNVSVAPQLTIRPGHPLFLDLPWSHSIAEWELPILLDLPKGISRHEVRFLSFPEGTYVVKELATELAHNDYAVLRALEDLPVEFRQVELLADVEGFSYREIADILNIPIGTVMSRLYRARRRLQKMLWQEAQELGYGAAGASV